MYDVDNRDEFKFTPARADPKFNYLEDPNAEIRRTALRAGLLAVVLILGAGVYLYLQVRGFGPLAYCRPGQWPQYSTGFNLLSQELDDVMGNPVECEHGVSAAGDTEQKTSTGLATYSAATNTPAFQIGTKHWAWTKLGLVTWTGDSRVMPADAQVVKANPTAVAQNGAATASANAASQVGQVASDARDTVAGAAVLLTPSLPGQGRAP